MKKIKSATGIRNKIFYGFAILGMLLFISGLVSFFELSRLSATTQKLFDDSIADIRLSETMLNALEGQNLALLLLTGERETEDALPITIDLDSLFHDSRNNFLLAYDQAAALHPDKDRVEDIWQSAFRYNSVVSAFRADTLGIEPAQWYVDTYRLVYYDLSLAIKNFMLLPQQTLDDDSEIIQRNAYRAIMPGIITLGVAIIIIVLFFGLIDSYFIKPLIAVNKGLRNYLTTKVPYKIDMEMRDELKELNEHIESLLNIIRKKDTN